MSWLILCRITLAVLGVLSKMPKSRKPEKLSDFQIEEMTASEARDGWTGFVNAAAIGKKIVRITRHGRVVAWLYPPELGPEALEKKPPD